MIELDIPGRGKLALSYVLLDVNGTIATDGRLIEGVSERLDRLGERVECRLVTADTHGRQSELDARLGTEAVRIDRGQERTQKASLVRRLGPEACCYLGNGANDAAAVGAAVLGIAVLGQEGVAVGTLMAADVLAPSINAALDMLLHPARLIATLRR